MNDAEDQPATSEATATTDVEQLIRQWIASVQQRRINGVTAHHADDIVMFDVPVTDPIRGLAAYRKSWLQFFEWLGTNGQFDFTALTVVANNDVAFAYGELRCRGGSHEASELSIRLTIGMQKRDGQWIVRHEHHSEASTP